MSTDDTSGSIYSAPESDTSTTGSDDLFAAARSGELDRLLGDA